MTQQATPPVRRAHRDPDEGLLGGVCAGLATHVGVPVAWVRVVFVASVAIGGVGILLYLGLWMVLPVRYGFVDDTPGLAAARRQGRRAASSGPALDQGRFVAALAIAVGGAAFLLVSLGGWPRFWPVLLGGVGLVVLWRQADEAQRERWMDAAGRPDAIRMVVGSGGWASYVRIGVGLAAVITSITLVSLGSGDWRAVRDVAVAATLGTLGLVVIVGPWLFRLATDLGEERAERVRSQERADMAAHLHDSVLQTLALIQRAAADPATVARLARAQERDLRDWLFHGPRPPSGDLATALRTVAAEVEDGHGVPVEVVCVGTTAIDDRLHALLGATREAVGNAARHSGAERIDVYAEVDGDTVDVFVRDRGVGFDPSHLPADRHGIRDSIVARMERHGGTATISSRPGRGTEVRLTQPLPTSEGP